MVDTYSGIEASLEQAVQEQGVEDAVNWAAQRAQDDVGQAGEQMQEAMEQAAEQVAHGTLQILG